MCVVWQNFDCRTKTRKAMDQQARENDASMGQFFLGARGEIRCYATCWTQVCSTASTFGEFDDIQVSVLCCVPSMWLTFVTKFADESLRWQIGGANLEEIGERKGRASAQASRREGCQKKGGGLLLGSAELPAARHLHPGCCRDLCCAAWVSDSPMLKELIFVLQTSTH